VWLLIVRPPVRTGIRTPTHVGCGFPPFDPRGGGGDGLGHLCDPLPLNTRCGRRNCDDFTQFG
jgi:hypothetical protein